MRVPVKGALLAWAVTLWAASAAQAASSIQWRHSFDQAIATAKTNHKLVMVDFYADW